MRLVLLFSVCLWLPNVSLAQDQPPEDSREMRLETVDKLLKEWDQAGTLPEGVVIRVDADLLGPNDNCKDKAAANKPIEETGFHEHWEFTAKHAHRVATEFRDNKWVRTTLETKPFESKKICQALLTGKATQIAARKGTGEPKQFVGTGYRFGGRSVEFCKARRRFCICSNTAPVPDMPRRMLSHLPSSMKLWRHMLATLLLQ